MSWVEVCGECRFWCGRCLKGDRGVLASTWACDRYEKREVESK